MMKIHSWFNGSWEVAAGLMNTCLISWLDIVSWWKGSHVALAPPFLGEKKKEITINNLWMDLKRTEANGIRGRLNSGDMEALEAHYMLIAKVHKWEAQRSGGQRRSLDEEEWLQAATPELVWKERNQPNHVIHLLLHKWEVNGENPGREDLGWANAHQTKINNNVPGGLAGPPAGWMKTDVTQHPSLGELEQQTKIIVSRPRRKGECYF